MASTPDPLALWRDFWRPYTFVAPSGDVTQSLVSITSGASGNVELEHRITARVASYGRQLGRILDVLDVLTRHLDGLSPEDQAAVEALREMSAEIRAEKDRAAGEELVAAVRALAADPTANRAVLAELREALS